MNVDPGGRHIRVPWQERHEVLRRTSTTGSRRLPMTSSMSLTAKNHIVAMISEFVGTFLFLFFALGGTNVVNAAPPGLQPVDLAANPAKLLYIALCFGMSLAVNAWVFFRISGGLFNPAVTLGMMVVGATAYFRGILVIIAQLLGAIAAAAVVHGLLPGELNVTTTLGGGTSVVQGLFLEMFLTAQLVFAIFMLAAEKHRATFIAPVGIGLSLFIGELVGVYYTGGSLNPARSFGPSCIQGSFPGYHWIYWVGPILGSLLASGFYMLIKALEYETVNPRQDHAGDSDEAFTQQPTSGSSEKSKRDDFASPSTNIEAPSLAMSIPHIGRISGETRVDSTAGPYHLGSELEEGNIKHMQ